MTFYSPIHRMENVLNELFKTPGKKFNDASHGWDFSPRISFKEDENHYLLAVELPGVKKENVDISFRGDQLVISGERKENNSRKEGGYEYEEFSYGSFSRTVTLPKDVDKERVSAELQDGVLTIDLAKNDKSKIESKKIQIK